MLLAPPTTFGYYVAPDEVSDVSPGATVTASGTAHTMGSWTNILSSILYDIFWVEVSLYNASTTATAERVLVDLGIGPDASNVTVIAEFLNANNAHNGMDFGGRRFIAPLFIPAGTQLWARCQSNIVSNTVDVCVRGWGGPDRPANFPVVYLWKAEGENTSGSNGTAITPGTAAWGAYAQLTAAAALDYCGAMFSHVTDDTTITQNPNYNASLGLGAATEQDVPMLYHMFETSTEQCSSRSIGVYADIPAGLRIAARMFGGGAPNSTITAIAYGLAY